jgi:hypothetical protein
MAYFTDVKDSTNNTFTVSQLFVPPSQVPDQYFIVDPNNSTGIVIIPAGQTVLFLSDRAAETPVTFPEGEWSVIIKTDSDWSGYCSLAIEECTPPGGNLVANSESAFSMSLTTYCQSFTVRYGYYIGIRITNQDVIDHSCFVDGGSYIRAPQGEPSNPVPEVPAGMLFGIGLAGLSGFILIKKKQAFLGK